VILEPIELEPFDDDRHEVELGPADRPRRWRGVGVGAVTVALVAAVALVGRNGGGTAAPPPTTPVTTAPPATTTPPTTDGAPRRTGPSFTDHQTFLSFLPGATGTTLYGVADDGDVVRIDLDAGRVSERRLRRRDRGQTPVTIFGRSGQAVVASANQALAVGDGADGTVTFLAADTIAVLPSAIDGELWLVRSLGPAGRVVERRRLADASVVVSIDDLPDGNVLGDDGSGGLLVQTGDGVYRVDDVGRPPQRVSTEPLVAWSAATFVTASCDDRLPCEWSQVDRASGERRSLGTAPWGGSVLGAELSPDGTHLAYLGGEGGPAAPALEVMDLTSGTRLALDHSALLSAVQGTWRGLVWSPDGQWLFWVEDSGALKAWRVGQEQATTVDGAGHVPTLEAIGPAA
jgi:hypothetical protein